MGLLALPAGSPQFDVDRAHRADRVHGSPGSRSVQFDTVDIAHRPAMCADEMMMVLYVGVEAVPLLKNTNAGNHSLFLKKTECSVDRIQ